MEGAAMKKRYSGKRIMIRMFSAMIAVTLTCLLVCGSYALYSTQKELVFCNDAAMDVYFSGMVYTLEDLEQFCNNIYYEDTGFHVLALEPEVITEDQALLAWNNIRLMVRSRITSNTGIMVFDDRSGRTFYSFGSQFLGGLIRKETIHTMELIRSIWSGQANPEAQGWRVLVTDTAGDSVILMQARNFRNIYICAMVDVTAYSGSFENQDRSSITYSFLTSDQILTNKTYASEHGISLEQMLQADGDLLHVNGMRYILQTRFDEKSGLGLCSMVSTNSMWGTWWVFVILLSVAVLVICVTFWGIYLSAQKILIYPLKKIQEISQQIADGAVAIQKVPENLQEIAEIQDALEILVAQKVTLETETMRQETQKEHAMLQYYQLQTRSHFLLNCLKTLYNLTVQGDQEGTLQVITRFSNHIRYIFHDSLTFVPVRSELAEVDDYFQIITLERNDHILLTKSVDPQLMDYPIPPLLIQTFLENFQKHNPQSGKLLHFSIRIDRVALEGTQFVRIRMTDNGTGYSDEALEQLQHMDGVFAQFHVGIQNLCRRIEILYKNRHKTAFYNLPNGGACSVFYLPDSFPPNVNPPTADSYSRQNTSSKEEKSDECTVCR